ncbi:hypothetical protein CNMCM7691_006516 [Aspergillus felis]|uniref:Cyanovirin-N domain-containing protein n=1 Tax=Aspergillus felis TaxID=1287682 RepID=A0A8H6QMY2_9EURO|nr:hypothetical protein CNMCM7691_006516 [Aspergillus felis]
MRATAFALLTALSASLVRAQGYSEECSDIYLNEGWLVATCPKDDANGNITSSVFLPNKIANNNAVLQWAVDGAYWNSCKDCTLTNSGSTLQCSCLGSASPYSNTTLNLEEHIANYNGHLLSNLTGAVTTVPADSSYPVPTDFEVVLELSTVNNSCAGIGGTLTMNRPTSCFYLNFGQGIEYSWACGNSVNNQGWEIVGAIFLDFPSLDRLSSNSSKPTSYRPGNFCAEIMSSNAPDLATVVDHHALRPANMRQVAEMWKNILVRFFPNNGYAQFPFRDTHYYINLDLNTHGYLGLGSVVRTQGFNTGVHFLQVNFTAAPADGSAFSWEGNEHFLKRELRRSLQSVPDDRKSAIYGLIAIGTYVRFYKYMPDSHFAPVTFVDGKQTLHIGGDPAAIREFLARVKEEWM